MKKTVQGTTIPWHLKKGLSDYKKRFLVPKQVVNLQVTQRNEPCPCGSGLKFKKCCLT
jgi:uncharacterized protein YecA (UPF0149 family)